MFCMTDIFCIFILVIHFVYWMTSKYLTHRRMLHEGFPAAQMRRKRVSMNQTNAVSLALCAGFSASNGLLR